MNEKKKEKEGHGKRKGGRDQGEQTGLGLMAARNQCGRVLLWQDMIPFQGHPATLLFCARDEAARPLIPFVFKNHLPASLPIPRPPPSSLLPLPSTLLPALHPSPSRLYPFLLPSLSFPLFFSLFFVPFLFLVSIFFTYISVFSLSPSNSFFVFIGSFSFLSIPWHPFPTQTFRSLPYVIVSTTLSFSPFSNVYIL